MPGLRNLVVRLSLDQAEFDAGFKKAKTSAERFSRDLDKDIRSLQIGKDAAKIEAMQQAGIDQATIDSLSAQVSLRNQLVNAQKKMTGELEKSQNLSLHGLTNWLRGGALILGINHVTAELERMREAATKADLVMAGLAKGNPMFDEGGMPRTSGIPILNQIEKFYNEVADAAIRADNEITREFGKGLILETAADRVIAQAQRDKAVKDHDEKMKMEDHLHELHLKYMRQDAATAERIRKAEEQDISNRLDLEERFAAERRKEIEEADAAYNDRYDMAAAIAELQTSGEEKVLDLIGQAMDLQDQGFDVGNIQDYAKKLVTQFGLEKTTANQSMDHYQGVGAALYGSQDVFTAIARAQSPQTKTLEAIQHLAERLVKQVEDGAVHFVDTGPS